MSSGHLREINITGGGIFKFGQILAEDQLNITCRAITVFGNDDLCQVLEVQYLPHRLQGGR